MRHTRTFHRFARPLLVALVLIAAMGAPPATRAQANIWCVSPGGDSTAPPCTNREAYLSIGDAFRDAGPGDEIRLARGVYGGGGDAVVTLAFNQMRIVGGFVEPNWATPAADPSLTVIDGEGERRGFFISAPTATLANLTVRNGRVPPMHYGVGGGIFSLSTEEGTIALDRVVVRDSQAPRDGGGVAISGSARLFDTELIGNRADQDGGGLWVAGALSYQGGLVRDNIAGRNDGGVVVGFEPFATTPVPGGCDCADVRFEGNTAQTGSGGGIYLTQTSSLSRMAFLDNQAGRDGGALNQALIHLTIENPIVIADSLFLRNRAGVRPESFGIGGAMAIGKHLTLLRSRLEENQASSGGAVAIRDILTWMEIRESRLAGNVATEYGGGAIYTGGIAVLYDSELVGNTAAVDGGGFFQYDPRNGRPLTLGVIVSGSTVTGNTATAGSGGGIALADPLLLEESLVAGNTAGLNGGGVALTAPVGIYRDDPQVLRRSVIAGNTAGGSGGGVYLAPTGPVEATELTLRGNSAGADGGGLFVGGDATALAMTGVMLADNEAGGAGHAIGAAPGVRRSLDSASLVNVTAASAEARAGAALALPLPALAVTLTNTLIASHTVGLSLGGPDATGPFSFGADYLGLFGVTTPVSATGGTIIFDPPTLIAGDPRFVDPGAGDYRLGAGSPLIDQGDPARDYTGQRDFQGQAVPTGPRADIGADEYRPVVARLHLPLLGERPPYPPLP